MVRSFLKHSLNFYFHTAHGTLLATNVVGRKKFNCVHNAYSSMQWSASDAFMFVDSVGGTMSK